MLDEQVIAAQLLQLGWSTTHGHYYIDPAEGRWRELDISASKFWIGSRNRSARVLLLVEHKRLTDYHVVFSAANRTTSLLRHAYWLGYDHLFTDLTAALELSGLGSDKIGEAISLYKDLRYPKHRARVWGLLADPPAAPILSSAFRETNTKNDRELGSSVIWKSSLALESAVRSIGHSFARGALEDLTGDIMADIVYGDLDDTLPSLIASSLDRVEIYHPVLILDAQLWATYPDGLRKVPWCRFVRPASYEIVWWFDIVSSHERSDYLRMITKHYNIIMRRARPKKPPARRSKQ